MTDYYQGDGEAGPFGFHGGWFVAWRIEGDRLAFDLDEDETEEPVSSEEEARHDVAAWLTKQERLEHSHALTTIRRKCRELAAS